VACVFTVLLMILVGAVFVSGPAELLAGMTPSALDVYFWMVVIFLKTVTVCFFLLLLRDNKR
jgi:carbon starvation protein CstA